MEHVADTWPAPATGERRTVRVLAALAVSVLCHATVLVLVRGWRLEGSANPPLVVTMVERGGGEGVGAGDVRSAAMIAAAPAPPAVAPAHVPPRPVAPRAVARRVDPPAPPRVATVAT